MGANLSREELEISLDEEEEKKSEDYQEVDDSNSENKSPYPFSFAKTKTKTKKSGGSYSLDNIDAKLKSLKLKYLLTRSSQTPNPNSIKSVVKFYFHIGVNTLKAKWITSENLTSYGFVISKRFDDHESEGEEIRSRRGGEEGRICTVGYEGSGESGDVENFIKESTEDGREVSEKNHKNRRKRRRRRMSFREDDRDGND